jgi:Polyketide cyclase / dehydrase and lipid transport
MRITEQIEIDASPADVWAVVSDLSTHTAWRPSLVEFRQVSAGPLAVGSRVREVLRWRGRDLVLDDVVTVLDPERRFALSGSWPAADFDLELRLEPLPDGTRVTFDWPLRPRSFLLRVAAPLLRGTMRRATVQELEYLKRYVEERSKR